MNLKIGSIAKAVAILLGLFFGSDVISDTKVDQIGGALAVLGAIAWDLIETFKLHKQGIVSTSPAENVAAPGSPQQALKEERKKPKLKEGA